MLGDFVKGKPSEGWDASVRAAILKHRAIDRFTDQHPTVVSSRMLVHPDRRRFAGILVDIFYDHFLAVHWQRYHATPLAEFTREIYNVLLLQHASFPPRLQRMLPWMASQDWLASYAEIESIDAALTGMARRLRFPERGQGLKTGVTELKQNYAQYEAHFLAFFPDLRAFAATLPEPPRD